MSSHGHVKDGTKSKSLCRPISSNLSSYAGGDSRFGIPSVSPLFASWPRPLLQDLSLGVTPPRTRTSPRIWLYYRQPINISSVVSVGPGFGGVQIKYQGLDSNGGIDKASSWVTCLFLRTDNPGELVLGTVRPRTAHHIL